MAKEQGPSAVLLLTLATAGLLVEGYRRARGLPHAPARLPLPGAGRRPGGEMPGWTAANPLQIPARGWWDVVKRVVNAFNDDRLMTEAAGVTFYTLLAIFPALATLVSIYGLFADPVTVNDQMRAIEGIVPGGGLDIIEQQIKALTANGRHALGVGVAIGLLTSLWTSNQGMKALFDALNIAYHEKEKRGFVWRTFITLGFTLGGILFIVIAMAAIVVVPIVLNFFGLGSWAALLVAAARWPALMVVLALFLSVIYRFGPSRTQARWKWVSAGSVFAAVAWLLASIGFSYYVSNFGSYNKTYGSLGAAIGFMTWIWISAMIVLLGGELNAELEQQTGRDTTVGPPKPIGQRGAHVADVKA